MNVINWRRVAWPVATHIVIKFEMPAANRQPMLDLETTRLFDLSQ